MNCKIIESLPFGAKPITPQEFAVDRKTVLLDIKKPMLLSVDNCTVVEFNAGLVEVPIEPANALVNAGALIFGYEFSESPKVQLHPAPRPRHAGYGA